MLEFVVTIVLLVGAIQLLRRRRSGAKTLVGFAWLDLIMNFIGAAAGMLVVQAQADMLKANPDLLKGSGALPPSAGMAIVIGGFLLTCVWPAFLIIWFGREKIRDAMDRWDERLLEEGGI